MVKILANDGIHPDGRLLLEEFVDTSVSRIVDFRLVEVDQQTVKIGPAVV